MTRCFFFFQSLKSFLPSKLNSIVCSQALKNFHFRLGNVERGLNLKLEGKFEDYLLHKSKKLVISFIFKPFSNDQVFFFFSVFKEFSAFQIKFNSLLAGSLNHTPPKAKTACLQGETRINH